MLDDREVAAVRRIWGGLLVIVVGVVLAVVGVGGGVNAAAGAVTCGGGVIGVTTICPTGTITVTSVTEGPGQPPATWSVTVTSTNNCIVLQDTFTVPDGGTAVSPPLFVYTDSNSNVQCSYSLAVTAVAPYTPSFDPAGPYVLPEVARNSNVDVTLRNVAAVVTTAPATSAAPTTAAPSASVAPTTVTARPTTTSAVLAATGPATTVRWTLWAGLATVAVGVVLVVAGWRSRGGAGRIG